MLLTIAAENRTTSASRKVDMVQYLDRLGTEYPPNATKVILYKIILARKPPPVYQIDNLLKLHGHEVIRLPPYHCDLNTIELVWGHIKNNVAKKKRSFKLRDEKNIVHEEIRDVTPELWNRCVQHVLDIEQQYWKKDGLQKGCVNPVIVDLNSDSDTDVELGVYDTSGSDGEQ
ncbi:uncharacterized protein LOC124265791 [Haliotis rubra]|uniref:uncharacterized protein LOC124265791 n=1 Tax=Haliotis rubra TaxID=36100 RepID=UPI001EE618F7|nr:uncharacterized protein LOC124265791 [Haliotis rubra]